MNKLVLLTIYYYSNINFKSMLHDWPDKEAKQFILKASQSLEPGGTLLIFERGPLEARQRTLPYSMIPFLLFFVRFVRQSSMKSISKDVDFQDIGVEKIYLETRSYIVTAKKKLSERRDGRP